MLNSSKFDDFVQAFGPYLSISVYLALIGIQNEILEILFFSGKIVTSFGNIFTWKKP